MKPGKRTNAPASSVSGAIGELVLQNGRQAGSRRPLASPTTFIGRAPGCDVRLNIDGIDSMHCVLVVGDEGITIRDLNSTQGTFINGNRVTSTLVRNQDLITIGPLQFRLEAAQKAAPTIQVQGNAALSERDAFQIQVASVAAQQIALEEQEARLIQTQQDLHQQEQQLAAHLAQRQLQVQQWSEHTKAERDALRKQKAEQQKILGQWEQELNQVKDQLGQEQQRLSQERQRITKVYERLRQRWQRQWSAEKQKYHELGARIEAENKALEIRQSILRDQETAFAQDVRRFNTERELGLRKLQESWDELKLGQASWKRRHGHERALAKARQRKIEDALAKMNEARRLLEQEKNAWEKQRDILQKELHGLNNRVVHQRLAMKEQEERRVLLDQELRTRLLQIKQVSEMTGARPLVADSDGSSPPDGPATSNEEAREEAPKPELFIAHDRAATIERLAGELADQRIFLLEQYKRLAEIQDEWCREREHAAHELEAAAHNLIAKETELADREKEAIGTEMNLQQQREEVQTLRQEIQVWRARLKAREHLVDQEHHKRMVALEQQEELLQEQLAGLTLLRQRWNRRRQDEIEHLRLEQTQIKQERDEVSRVRQDLFEKSQLIEEEKRILTEKSLAVEQFRQETAGRTKDPIAERRIERIRRRWLTQNAAQIRLAKSEREIVSTELIKLQARLEDWAQQMAQLMQVNTVLGEQQRSLEEREAALKARELRIEQRILQAETLRHIAEDKYARMKDEVESMAKVVYDQVDAPTLPFDRAA